VQDLVAGDCVVLTRGGMAQVGLPERSERARQHLIELVTNQGNLKLSADHRVVVETPGGRTSSRAACELLVGDNIRVGTELRPLTRVTRSVERVELFKIRLQHEGIVEAFVMPNYGIHVYGSEPALMELFGGISEVVVQAAMPPLYEV